MYNSEIHTSRLNVQDAIEVFNGSEADHKFIVDFAKRMSKLFEPNVPFCESPRNIIYQRCLEFHAKEVKTGNYYDYYDETMPFNCLYYTTNVVPTSVHSTMSYPLIRTLGNRAQRSYYLPKMKSEEIRMAYAQTEIAHGSDVQNLMTRADYDKTTKEFVVHTPSVEAVKWWPGELAWTANWAVVFAQLYTEGKCHGVHPFLVQLRDYKTHRPLPGREIGDIGPKLDYSFKDNGFLRLTKVRIPRENLLMKYYLVEEDGTYKKRGNPKVMYTGMMAARMNIISYCYVLPSRAILIAMRYSHFRKQFKNDEGVERRLIDYQLQQFKLFTTLSNVWAIFMVTQSISRLYQDHLECVKKDDYSKLTELHMCMSGAKAMCTYWACSSLETCRMACGGAGFHEYSGIPGMTRNMVPNMTLEGDNAVMLLQTARILVASLEKASRGKPIPETASYLAREPENMSKVFAAKEAFGKMENLLRLWESASNFATRSAAQKLMEGMQAFEGSMKESWDKFAGNSLFNAGKLHIITFTLSSMIQGIQKFKNLYNQEAFKRLCGLFAINQMVKNASFFYESEVLNGDSIAVAKEAMEDLLLEIRPDAISWTEGFGIPEELLITAIGKKDANPYEELYRFSREYALLNQTDNESMVKELLFPLRQLKPRI